MPTYEYACTACDHRFEAVQSFSDPALTECPVCQGKPRKLFSSVGIVFRGPGFYRTDSRAGSGTVGGDDGKASKNGDKAAAGEKGGGEKGGEKSASKSGGDSSPATSTSGESSTSKGTAAAAS